MKKLISILVILFVGATVPVKSQSVTTTVTPEYKAKVMELLEVTNYYQSLETNLKSVYSTVPQLKDALPDMINKLHVVTPPLIVDSYAKFFTLDDLDYILEFKKSPVGQKEAQLIPYINSEGQEYGRMMVTDPDMFEALPYPPASYMKKADALMSTIKIDAIIDMIINTSDATKRIEHILRPGLTKSYYLIFYKHYTADELDAMLAFNTSPIGKKFTGSQEALMKDLQEKLTPVMTNLVMEYLK